MGTWLSAGSSSPPAWTLVTPQPGQGPSQSVHTNLTPPVATFNIRLLTDIMSISPGPSPTYLYTVVIAMLEMLLNLQNAGESQNFF